MDTSFVDVLTRRACTMLPPATVMKIECAGDATGDLALLSLLEEVQGKGLRGEPLCLEPWEPVIFEDRVLLRCRGCSRMENLPRVAGIGRGRDGEEAHRNALYALTIPLDRPGTALPGCISAHIWGKGPAEDVQYACILNRTAYLRYPEAK